MSLGGGKGIGPWEERAFNDAYNAGVLSIAAAGNDGSTNMSYPASYDSVISVAAIDSNKVVADFSQKNSQVELAAPGVAVLSTVPFKETNTLTVDGVTYQGNYIENAARTDSAGVSGGVVDGGLCDSSGSWGGNVVLCERGSISFYDKVMNVENGGGAAAVIYNNESGNFYGTLGDGYSSTIPAISLSQEDGQYLVTNKLGLTGGVVSYNEQPASGYEAWNGTSMATPHVSGVAALVWSNNMTGWTNADIRNALAATAEDLGDAGRDNSYGYGLVQAKAALDYLGGGGDGGSDTTAPTTSITSPTDGSTVSGTITVAADASDDTGVSSVEFYLDGALVGSDTSSPYELSWDTTTSADGSHSLQSKAYDAAGNVGTSATVSVTVDNSTDPGTGITLSVTAYKVKGLHKADLAWSGATSTNVDIYRDGGLLVTTANDGAHTDNIDQRGGGSYTYQVCEAGTSTCSSEVTATF